MRRVWPSGEKRMAFTGRSPPRNRMLPSRATVPSGRGSPYRSLAAPALSTGPARVESAFGDSAAVGVQPSATAVAIPAAAVVRAATTRLNRARNIILSTLSARDETAVVTMAVAPAAEESTRAARTVGSDP